MDTMFYGRRMSNIAEYGAIIECKAYNIIPNIGIETFALIDSGGTFSCIDDSIISKLNLSIKGTKLVKGTSDKHNVVQINSYEISVSLINPQESRKITIGVIHTNLSTEKYKIILGRNFLQHCKFMYSGKEDTYSLEI